MRARPPAAAGGLVAAVDSSNISSNSNSNSNSNSTNRSNSHVKKKKRRKWQLHWCWWLGLVGTAAVALPMAYNRYWAAGTAALASTNAYDKDSDSDTSDTASSLWFRSTTTTSSTRIIAASRRRRRVPFKLYSDNLRYDVVFLANKLWQQRLARSTKQGYNESNNITAAICYKTLFGDVQLHHVMTWAAYHYLLGFDRVFLWYLPDTIPTYAHFDELSALPYVTLIPNLSGLQPKLIGTILDVDNDSDNITTEENRTAPRGRPYYSMAGHGNFEAPGAQKDLERTCLQHQYAGAYDWAFFADTDEYLWFRHVQHSTSRQKTRSMQSGKQPRGGVKEFLRHYHDQNITYLSLGKKIYTLTARGDESSVNNYDLGFGVDAYPFTAGAYCRRPSPTVVRKNLNETEYLQQSQHMAYCYNASRSWEQNVGSSEITTKADQWSDHSGENESKRQQQKDEKQETGALFAKDGPCYGPLDFRRGNPICPLWWGRCKILARTGPYAASGVNIHGQYPLSKLSGDKIHLHVDTAHVKEWPWIFQSPNSSKMTIRPLTDYTVKSNAQVNLHDITTGHLPNSNGTWTMKYDAELRAWFEFVASRGNDDSDEIPWWWWLWRS
jgi:hypothetical protein